MKRILLITAGATPQIVTETVWALATRPEPWIPDTLILATTAAGARLYADGNMARGISPLLGDHGKLATLFDTHLPQARPPAVRVCVAKRDGRAIEDVRSDSEVAAFAELLLREVSAVTADPDATLHMSLAGGRKTMSFLAGQVMSVFGRPEDVLSHVLVEPARFENPHEDFWWPGDGTPGGEAAQVLLHQVPFIRIRAWLDPERLIRPDHGYEAAISAANQLMSDDLLLDLAARRVHVGGHAIGLANREAAVLALILVAHMRGCELEQQDIPYVYHERGNPVESTQKRLHLDGDQRRAADLWAWLLGAASTQERDRDAVSMAEFVRRKQSGPTLSSDIGEPLSRLRNELGKRLPQKLAHRIVIPKGLGSALDPARIRIVCSPDLADEAGCPAEVSAKPPHAPG